MLSYHEPSLKAGVHAFWEAAGCGQVYATGGDLTSRIKALRSARYSLEPYILRFADFAAGSGRDVLEVGIGMGCDHVNWAMAGPRRLVGVDITERAIGFTSKQLALSGVSSGLTRADAEKLPVNDQSFDIVYSWGVLHHSPDTPKAVSEVYRVLRSGGVAKVMIYHTQSITGYMLWARYALLAGKPLRPLREIYAEHLESPGTKAYSVREARKLFERFSVVNIEIQINHGDLLRGEVGRRHGGLLLAIVKALWPRWLIRALFRKHGLYLLITAVK